MYHDEIIEEVWRLRDEYVARHNHDLSCIMADLKTRQNQPHAKLVDRRRKERGGFSTKPRMPA